ncbi:MAG: HAMP domain-containing sensor histidine kinase, partial [Pseudoflavonifractor sp.]
LRQSLLSSSSLVIAQGFKKCASEIFYSLSACVSKLKAAQVTVIDDQLKVINHNCYQIMRATGNLSERIKYASNIPPTVQCVDFWDNCAELFEACSTVLRARQISFFYELPESTRFVSCDFDKITTAILHVISNSYLYGGKDVQVSVTGRDGEDGVLLTLSDNGPGIPPDIQDRIFQPFCSWDCLDQQNAGIGLGLNIVRNIISQAGGEL